MSEEDVITVVCRAPMNIAVIKYQGKCDETLNIPVNSSLSATLHMDSLCSTTIIRASKKFDSNKMILNGKTQPFFENERIKRVYNACLKLAQDFCLDQKTLVKRDDQKNYKLHINSENNFPTAAGLASSASGYACLTNALAKLFCVKESFKGQLSTIARQGSGSACRSMYGGQVKQNRGRMIPYQNNSDELDFKDYDSSSFAVQIAEPGVVWPDLFVLILVVNSSQKAVSSTEGMRRSVNTSDFLKFRSQVLAEERIKLMEKFIKEKNFEEFASLTMKDSNQFHSICLDTYPPIFYLNRLSHKIIDLIHNFNKDGIKAAYTFDAGPNAVLFVRKPHIQLLFKKIFSELPCLDISKNNSNFEDSTMPNFQDFIYNPLNICEEFLKTIYDELKIVADNVKSDCLQKIIVTKLGPGPQIIKHKVNLIDII